MLSTFSTEFSTKVPAEKSDIAGENRRVCEKLVQDFPPGLKACHYSQEEIISLLAKFP